MEPAMQRTLRQAAPWAITLAALAYLFSRVPAGEVALAATRAAPWTIPTVVGLVVAVYLADCLAIWKTFGWFVAPLSFAETLTIRGATYLLALINYALGQGAFVYFLNRWRGVPPLRATGAVLLLMGVNMILLLLLSAVGLALGADVPPELRAVLLASVVGLVAYGALLVLRPAWLARRPIFDVLLQAGLGGHACATAVRLPHLAALLLLNYAALRAFGIEVPARQALVALPVVFFVAVLPISVQGLGPAQGAMIYFFARFAPGPPDAQAATVFAASLGTQAIAWMVQLAIGLVCLRTSLMRAVREGAARDAAA
jgi:hypothetical protein